MAQGFCFVCGKCDHTIVAWDDCLGYGVPWPKEDTVKTIQLWAVDQNTDRPSASPVKRVDNTETEKSLEDLLVTSPELLMPGLTLIGRQVPTDGGPLDLLGAS